ncbi:MAG: PAS domain S-box protein, partial [Ignavibacteria bacterium]
THLEQRWLRLIVTPISKHRNEGAVVMHIDVTERKHAEQALKLSEEQYRLLFYDNPLPMWVFDYNTLRIIAVNDESILWYGYSKSEFLKMKVTDLIHPDERTRYLEYRKNFGGDDLNNKARNVGIWKHVTKKGSVIDVEVTRRAVVYEGKAAILVLAKDITERNKALESLKKRTEELVLMYESSKELSNTLEIQSIYERIYKIVSMLMPCSGMGISSYDEKNKLITSQVIWQDGKKHDTEKIPAIKLDAKGKGLQSRVIMTRKSIFINDYDKYLRNRKTVYYLRNDNSISSKKDRKYEIAKSALLVPLITEGKVIGVIQILSSQINAFNDDNLKILEALSSQAAAAMTNAKLYDHAQREIAEKQKAQDALKRKSEEISILYEAQKKISNTLDMNIVFDNIYKSVYAIMPCDTMIISSFKKEEKMIKVVAIWADGEKPAIRNYPELPLAPEGYGIQSEVIRSGESKLILDYKKHFKKSINNYSYSNDNISSKPKSLYSSALLVPMKIEGNVIGTIQVLSYKKNAFNGDNLRMLESLTSPITAATINAGLYQQAQSEIDERIKKEIELKEIRMNMEEAQRISHIGNWVLNTGTNEIYNSAEICCILGIEPITNSVPFEQMLKSIYEEDRDFTNKLINEAIREKKSYINEDRIIRPGGEIRFVRVMGEPIVDENGNLTGMQGTMQDITDFKRINDELMRSLGEKELMLKEIHHRVKNNLQIVSSLLRLQSEKIKDKTTVEYFLLTEQRVKSMALIHQQLYKSKDLSMINFKDYLKELCSYLFFVNGVSSSRINLNILVEEIYFGIDTALPCGLIVNELVTNSIKHAFPDGRKGNISISLIESKDAGNQLVVKDDGVGAGKLDFKNGDTLGMELVDTLTEQIEGRLEVNTDCGTEIRIIFKELYYKKRL